MRSGAGARNIGRSPAKSKTRTPTGAEVHARLGIWLVWPLTWGIDLVRQSQAGNWTIATWAASPDPWGVLAQAIVLTGLGLAAFQRGLTRATRQGSLAAY